MEKFTASQVRFWGEQDGQSERVLKCELGAMFEQHVEVRSAYLMVVDYGENTPMAVALCLDAGAGQHSALRQEIQTIFRSLFKENAHIDILFMTSDEVRPLKDICAPFYQPGTLSQTVQ